MTVLVSKIITEVRYTLSDLDKQRYEDARLIKLLNDAILDIAKNSTLLISTIYMVINNNTVDYDLSSFMVRLLRAEYNDVKLTLKTFEQMDELNPSWQLDKGSALKYLIYNKQKAGNFKLYPIVENLVNDNITYSSPYGIVTGISYSDILPALATDPGDLSSYPADALLKLHYIRRHPEVTSLTDELDIDENTISAIQHYIVGFALRDNHDQQNRAMGNEELKLYQAMMTDYSIQRFHEFAQEEVITTYNPMG